MSNSNKEVSDDSAVMKDARIEFRISTKEKEIFEEQAKNNKMSLSEYIISILRADVLKQDMLENLTPGGQGDYSIILRRIDQLEQALNQDLEENTSILKELSKEHREDLLMSNIRDKVYWMLLQTQFQKNTHKEIKELLIQKDLTLQEFLEESPGRMFTALDLALEKLQEDNICILSERGKVLWKK
ncbi:MAG TPA: hypothetical protein VMZ29_05650 [Candidatus Bathyarchaeia archaeon]|nr:hypothetical protein [Candidatus Bathyarchaeia archaeon]